MIPINKGGTNDIKNLVTLCKDCNLQKSDDIVDVEYYSYASKLVKKELTQLFNDYFEKCDWLSERNIFKYDQFSIPVVRNIKIAKGTKTLHVKDLCQISLLRDEKATTRFRTNYVELFENRAERQKLLETIRIPDYKANRYLKHCLYQINNKGNIEMLFDTELTESTESKTLGRTHLIWIASYL